MRACNYAYASTYPVGETTNPRGNAMTEVPPSLRAVVMDGPWPGPSQSAMENDDDAGTHLALASAPVAVVERPPVRRRRWRSPRLMSQFAALGLNLLLTGEPTKPIREGDLRQSVARREAVLRRSLALADAVA